MISSCRHPRLLERMSWRGRKGSRRRRTRVLLVKVRGDVIYWAIAMWMVVISALLQLQILFLPSRRRLLLPRPSDRPHHDLVYFRHLRSLDPLLHRLHRLPRCHCQPRRCHASGTRSTSLALGGGTEVCGSRDRLLGLQNSRRSGPLSPFDCQNELVCFYASPVLVSRLSSRKRFSRHVSC